jgi:hypothetical protein
MRRTLGLGLFLFVAALLFIPYPGISGDSPVWNIGGGPCPDSSDHNIRLESQEVTIRVGEYLFAVDALFHFFNAGKTKTEWVGFPKKGMGDLGRTGGKRSFIGFETWVDGKKVEFSEEPNLRKDKNLFDRIANAPATKDVRWLLRKIVFPGNAKTSVRVKYTLGSSLFRDVPSAEYLYGTSSYWKGSIGKAVFIIDSSQIEDTYAFKVRFSDSHKHKIRKNRVSDYVTRYEIQNFKPKHNCRLLVDLKPSSNGKIITGEVVGSSPRSLRIRVSEYGASEIMFVEVGLKTKFDNHLKGTP